MHLFFSFSLSLRFNIAPEHMKYFHVGRCVCVFFSLSFLSIHATIRTMHEWSSPHCPQLWNKVNIEEFVLLLSWVLLVILISMAYNIQFWTGFIGGNIYLLSASLSVWLFALFRIAWNACVQCNGDRVLRANLKRGFDHGTWLFLSLKNK